MYLVGKSVNLNSSGNCLFTAQVEGKFPKYGNDDDAVDEIATWVAETFSSHLNKQETYRNSIPTLSVLTITSNVVYGKKTGAAVFMKTSCCFACASPAVT
jgi:pyruvate-formate lyase